MPLDIRKRRSAGVESRRSKVAGLSQDIEFRGASCRSRIERTTNGISIMNSAESRSLAWRILGLGVVVLLVLGIAWSFADRRLIASLRHHRPHPAPPADVTFSQSSGEIVCYEFVEVTISVGKPTAENPFTDATTSGRFRRIDQGSDIAAEGFCDSADGTVYRVRFMPSKPGTYECAVAFRQDGRDWVYRGKFQAVDGRRRGVLRVDPQHPWHFAWEGTGEHYYLNGTTAFFLMGWEGEKVIRDCIDRLHRFDVNRIRVLLDGRTDHFWTEPIKPGNGFSARLIPWVAKRRDDVERPGFDYTRFNCSYWQEFERMLRYAREKDMIISVIFGWNDTKVHPAAGSEDERRYFSYAVARIAPFSNVTWDLGDDIDGFRSDVWTHQTGTMLYQADPYRHLATSHPVDNRYQDRTSLWLGMTSFQQWDRPLHRWMLDQRRQQEGTGRIIPQVNEEYGYEDHYPKWAPYTAPAASADEDRRAAWEIAMAGCYQTTGETAKRGTGVPPDTGGGWVNGRGDETMTMLQGYAKIVHFFKSIEWWTTNPHDELVNSAAFCLADPGKLYVVYLPHGGGATVTLGPGRYEAKWFNPRTGEYAVLSAADGLEWTSPVAADHEDWVLLLGRIELAHEG